MLVPGSSAYNATLDRMTSNPFKIGSGAVIVDDTQVIDADLIYDFEDSIDFANVIAGASYRSSELNTGGTLYTDYDGPIKYYQYGAFVQAKKDLLVNPKGSDDLHQAVSHSKIFTITSAGHGVIRQQNTHLNDRIIQHLSSVD